MAAETVQRPFAVVPLPNPRAVTVDPAGNLFVGDVATPKVYKITPSGQVTVLGAGGPTIADPIGLAVGRDGTVLVSDADANTVYRILPDGRVDAWVKPSPVPSDTSLSAPVAVALDPEGNAFIANNSGNTILRISPQGTVTVIAGKRGEAGATDGAGAVARFGKPRGIALDGKGILYVADEQLSAIRKVTSAGTVTTLAGVSGAPGSADGIGSAAHFGAPRALAADGAGNVYVADTDNHVIRKVTPAGVVTTLAGRAGERGKADGPAGTARFSEPRSIAVDATGTIYVADTGNGAIRQITPDGLVTTIAGATKP